jgi:hypothetical protein
VRLRADGTLSRDVLPNAYPAIDLGLPVVRRALEWVALATVANLLIIGTASYRGVEYMDSTNFCGTTCHTVMAPEYAAYQNSPHSRVACVECHIGPGAGWFVRSKLSGLRQVVAVTLHTYSRPIPSPVKYLRPARETCEQCHWPQRFTGDKLLVNTSYKDDEKNTPQTDVLLLKVGGRTSGRSSTIFIALTIRRSIKRGARWCSRLAMKWQRSTCAIFLPRCV